MAESPWWVEAAKVIIPGLSFLAVVMPRAVEFYRRETMRMRILKHQNSKAAGGWGAYLQHPFEHVSVANYINKLGQPDVEANVTFFTYQRVMEAESDFMVNAVQIPKGTYCYKVFSEHAIVIQRFVGKDYEEVLVSRDGNVVGHDKDKFDKIVFAAKGMSVG